MRPRRSCPAIERIVFAYLDLREGPDETFLQAYRRVGMAPFKAALYDEAAPRCRLTPPTSPCARRDLNARYRHHAAHDVLRRALSDPRSGRVALVSSFGAELVVLLHLVAVVDRTLPVLFLDTEMLFPETLAYQREVCRSWLGPAGCPAHAPVRRAMPDGTLHRRDPDACCALRKTEPLEAALGGFDAWITGRKRFQGGRGPPWSSSRWKRRRGG